MVFWMMPYQSGSNGVVVAQAKGYVWTRRRWLGAARGGGGGRAAAGARGGVGLWCVIIVDVVLCRGLSLPYPTTLREDQ